MRASAGRPGVIRSPVPYKRPDHYTRKAKSEGYAARSVFKLEELAERSPGFPRAGVAVDLGCYPGSWSRWLLQRGFQVVGVDLQAPELPGGTWLVGSALEVDAERLRAAAGGPVTLVVSDMAPNTSGNRFVDHARQLALARRALELAQALLEPGGSFVVKVFDGEDAPAFVEEVRARFADTRRHKPDATRDRSVEFFVVARGPRGPTPPGSRSTG